MDPRSTDSASRYLLPYPISALYRLVYGSHELNARFGFSLRLAEGIFKFLALVNLANAGATEASPKDLKQWLAALEQPGMGKWLWLLRSTTEHLNTHGGPFLEEVASLYDSEWGRGAEAITRIRNPFVHQEVHVSPEEARPLLAGLQEPLRAVLSGVQFLRKYTLGTAQGLKRTGSNFSYYWYASRGLEETCEPMMLRGRLAPIDNLPMLMHPRSGRALYLSPWVHWGLSEGDRAMHILWVDTIDTRDPRGAVAHFRHPVMRQETVRGLPDPEDPDAKEIPVVDYVARRAEYPGVVNLELDAPSAKTLDSTAMPVLESRFEVVGKLGEGGMGTVWEVHDATLDRRCALKQLRGEHLRTPAMLRRFVREGKLLAQLRHPSIVEVYEVGIGADHNPYLLMELVDGEDLGERLARAGPLGLDEAADCMSDVLEALHAIHAEKVIHRDVKPSNFIVTREGVRVVDFGIAVMAGGTRLTHAVDRMGTPDFMAPEQWSGDATTQSDLYAAGRLMFALLAGRPPKSPSESLTDAVPGLPPTIAAVYAKATQPAPVDRYSSARAMAEALVAGIELARAPAPVVVRPPTGALSESKILDMLTRAERTFPTPVAQAIHAVPVLVGPVSASTFLWNVFLAIEDTLRYLFATQVAIVGVLEGDAVLGAVRAVAARPSFGRWIDALAALALTGRGAARVTPRVVEHVMEVARLRNEIAHSQVLAKVGTQQRRDVLVTVARLLEDLAFLEEEELFVAHVTDGIELDDKARRVLRAVGCAPSAWNAETLAIPVSGMYLRYEGQLLPLDPLCRVGEVFDDLWLFAGQIHRGQGRLQFSSSLRRMMIEVSDSALTKEVRERLCIVELTA